MSQWTMSNTKFDLNVLIGNESLHCLAKGHTEHTTLGLHSISETKECKRLILEVEM